MGPDIAPITPSAERDDDGQVVLERRVRDMNERVLGIGGKLNNGK